MDETAIDDTAIRMLYEDWKGQVARGRFLELDQGAYGAFLSHIEWDELERATEVFANIERVGSIPSQALYETALRRAVERSELDVAMDLVREMWTKEYSPTEEVYCGVIMLVEQSRKFFL